MTVSLRFLPATALLSVLTALACRAEQSDLQQHAEACESLCAETNAQCSGDPAFTPTWQLACEVSCTLDFESDDAPLDACIEAAADCTAKDACTGGAPTPGTGFTAGESSAEGDDDTGVPEPDDSSGTDSADSGTEDDSGGESTGPGIIGHACCDISGAPCEDPAVRQCACDHMPSCCNAWDESCASVAVANGCIDDGCSTLDGQEEWQCSCSTTDVYCPDEPFVSQIIFGTDACGLTQPAAMAIAEDACEQGDGECMIGAGSCECTCASYGDVCGPAVGE